MMNDKKIRNAILIFFAIVALCVVTYFIIHALGKKGEYFKNGDGSPISLTTYFDCSGQSCDSALLQPWDPAKFRVGPGYMVLDPADHGGSLYGEKMWIYGAASSELGILLGDNDGCCGSIDHQGDGQGCGKSILIKNPTATNADWTALVMRKSFCPDGGTCVGKIHMDLMIPGFDYKTSQANICGQDHTVMLKDQSNSCSGDPPPPPKDCTCDNLPCAYKKGCKLFVEWGWPNGAPGVAGSGAEDAGCTYKIVVTPPKFIEYTENIQLGGKCAESMVPCGGAPTPPPPPPPPPATCEGKGVSGAPPEGCCVNSPTDLACKDPSDWCAKCEKRCSGCSPNFWCSGTGTAPECP